jgi:hypothetical protein
MIRISVIITCFLVVLALSNCNQPSASGTLSDKSDPPPASLYVDDFEDGDKDNIIGTWVHADLDDVNSFDTVVTPPGYGNYVLKLAGAIYADSNIVGSLYAGASSLHTGDPGVANPVNVIDYESVCFGLSFDGTSGGTNMQLNVLLSGANDQISYELFTGFDGEFKEYSLPFSDFTVDIGSLSALKESVEQIKFSVYMEGGQNETLEFILIVDDVRFEE